MELVIWTLAGALAGVLLNMLLRHKALSDLATVLTAATAAVVGGYLVAPALGLTEAGDTNLPGLVVALMCAVVGVSIANQHREDV